MLVVIVLAARWVVRRFTSPFKLPTRLGTGCVALALLLAAEITFVLAIRGLSFPQYIAGRDPVAGTVYVLLLLLLAAMPLLVARR